MLWLIPLVPLVCAPLLYLAARRRPGRWVIIAAAAVLTAAGGLVVLGVWHGWEASYPWSSFIRLRLEPSTAGAVYALTVPLVALPVIIYAGLHPSPPGPHDQGPHDQGPNDQGGDARLSALMVAFVGAMTLLVLAADMLTLLIAWELVGACSWALIAHRWWEPATARDATRAFLVTRSGDLGLYAAAAVLFSGTGSFEYEAIAALDSPLLQVFAAGVLVAAAAKSAQLPFAPWLFAAMSGPVPVSALLHAATMVAAGVFLLVRLYPSLDAVPWAGPVVLGVGLATALAGGLVASLQPHAKKLLAASTSAQYGLMWVAVGAGYPGVALLHFVAHACLKAPLFLAVGACAGANHHYGIDELAKAPAVVGVATAALLASLALAGVPPLGAAWTKEAVIGAAGHEAIWLVPLVALAGGLSALYATRLQLGAFGLPTGPRRGLGRLSAEVWPIAVLALLTLSLSVLWWPALRPTLEAGLDIRLPALKLWELGLSLALVALGIAVGAWLATRGSSAAGLVHEDRGALKRAAAWLGLPALAERMIAQPLQAATQSLARFDDRLLGSVTSAQLRRPAQGLSRFDNRLLGAATSAQLRRPAQGLSHFDDAVVAAGLSVTARVGTWLARLGAGVGELLADGLPIGAARGAGRGGRWVQALHSGLAHRYYLLAAGGLVALVLILGLGGLF